MSTNLGSILKKLSGCISALSFGIWLVGPCVGAAIADALPNSLVMLEIKAQGGVKTQGLAVAVAPDSLVTSCVAISEAVSIDAVAETRRTPLTLTAILPLEDLCRLSGQIGATKQLMSSRAAIKVGSTLSVYVLDAQGGTGWKNASVTVNQKLDGGTNRMLYLDPRAVSSQTNLPLTAEGAAFDKDAKFVGLVSPILGAADAAGIVMLVDLEQARWFVTDADPTTSKSKTKPSTPVAQLSSVRNRLGAGLSYIHLAEAYQRTGNYAKMLAVADKWKAEDGNNPAAYGFAAIALDRLKFADRSSAEIEKAIARYPSYLPGLSISIGIKEREGRGTESEIIASKALAIEPSDSADEAIRVFLLTRLKRNDEALTLAQKLYQEEPKASYVQAAYCRAAIAAGQRDKAIEICKQYVESTPDRFGGWLALSNAYANQTRYDDALAAAKKAIEINPEIAESWATLGIIAEAKGETQRANEAEQRIKDLDPSLLERFSKNRSVQHCYRDRRNKAYADAINSCRDAARLDNQNAGVQYALGNALLWEKRADEGIAAHENAVRLNPDLKGSWSDLTYAYANKKDSAKTRTALEHLRSLDSSAADAVYAKVRNVLN